MMAFYTIERIYGHLMAYYTSSDYRAYAAWWLGGLVLAWAIWMHALYLAHRIEQRRTDIAEPPADEMAGIAAADH